MSVGDGSELERAQESRRLVDTRYPALILKER